MIGDPIGVSFIISTRNRGGIICFCLDAVAESLAQVEVKSEIVIVDNGSTDSTSDNIQAWARQHPDIQLVLLFEEQPGVSRGRNAALRRASGDLLIFTDDDCRPSRSYVAEALDYFASDDVLTIRGGLVSLGDPQDLPITINEIPKPVQYSIHEESAKSTSVSALIPGCNMAMSRKVFDLVGFFDERLGPGSPVFAGEDEDYMFRAYLAGVRLEHVPAMLVYHFHGRRTMAEAKKLMAGYMIAHGALCAKFGRRSPDILRPAVWDIKNLLRSLGSNVKVGIPEFNLSGWDLLRLRLLGATIYTKGLLAETLKRKL